MKKFKIPKIIRTLDFKDYAPEYNGHSFDVWVNPSQSERVAFSQVQREIDRLKNRLGKLSTPPEDAPDDWQPNDKEIGTINADVQKLGGKAVDWWALIWSQGEDEASHASPDEVREFMDLCLEDDFGLWLFVTGQSMQMIFDHAAGAKKK